MHSIQPQFQPLPPQQPGSFNQAYAVPQDPALHGGWASPQRRQSGLGLTSLFMSLVIGLGMIAAVFYAGFLESTTPGGIDEESSVAIFVGLVILIGMLGNFIGIVLAAVGLAQRDRAKTAAVLGLSFNAVCLVGIIGLMILGTLVG